MHPENDNDEKGVNADRTPVAYTRRLAFVAIVHTISMIVIPL